MSNRIHRIRTFPLPDEGGGTLVHLDGPGDSYTLCGFDTAGDSLVHRKPPESARPGARVTCKDCLSVINVVKEYLSEKN